MSNVQLSVSLSNPTDGLGDDILFWEQEEYSPYTGKVTKAGMALAVLGWLYPDEGYDTENSCGGAEGVFDVTAFAYLYQQDLNYKAKLSYGSLGIRTIQELPYVEILKCGLQDQVKFSYPNERMLSEPEWVGSAYNNRGEVVGLPSYTYDNRGMTFNSKVYGSLKVTYLVRRHAYSLTIESREHEDEDETTSKYQSTVFAVWTGGIEWLEVTAPHGFEEFDGDCGNGDTLKVPKEPEDTDPPSVSPENKTTNVDYCTQEVEE